MTKHTAPLVSYCPDCGAKVVEATTEVVRFSCGARYMGLAMSEQLTPCPIWADRAALEIVEALRVSPTVARTISAIIRKHAPN